MLGLDWDLSASCCLRLAWKTFEMQFHSHDILEIVIFRGYYLVAVKRRRVFFALAGKYKNGAVSHTGTHSPLASLNLETMAFQRLSLLFVALLALHVRAEGLDKMEISGMAGIKNKMGAILLNTFNPLKNVAAAGQKGMVV